MTALHRMEPHLTLTCLTSRYLIYSIKQTSDPPVDNPT